MKIDKVSKLFDAEDVIQHINYYGNIENIQERKTGKSTAMALGFISKAMLSPETDITIFDHYESSSSTRMMAYMIKDLTIKLGLKHITSKKEGTIRYSIYY